MNSIKVVCPFDSELIAGLEGQNLVVKVDDLSSAVAAAAAVASSRNRLICIQVETAERMEQLQFDESLTTTPLAVFSGAFGNFRQLTPQLSLLRQLNLRVYLGGDNRENLAGLRILASLGIHGGVVFGPGPIEWEGLADLMTYAVLERTAHATIEPFSYIAGHYDPLSTLDWSALYFEQPGVYLHLDKQGRVAFSRTELQSGRFFAESISACGEQANQRKIEQRRESWREFFLDNHPCASCIGWKQCLGKFAGRLPSDKGCVGFFEEMLEVVRQYRRQCERTDKERPLWQP